MTANEERFLFTVDGLKLGVLEFRVTEELSLPFLADISLVSRSDLDFDEIIGKKACLTIVGENEDRYVHGQVIQLAHTGATGKHNIYNLQLVPSMWLLSLQTDCRIFQQKTVPEIITQLLEESNITSDQFEMRLKSDYAPREYCVQYRESDLDFLSRLLEEEGIFFYFEHTYDNHLLVFGDDPLNYQDIPGGAKVLFNPSTGMVPDLEFVYRLNFARKLHTGKVSLRDYWFEKPSMDLSVDTSHEKHSELERYDYPGTYAESEVGQARAEIRLQQVVQERELAQGSSVCPRLLPGFVFELRSKLEFSLVKQRYLVCRLGHVGTQPMVLEERDSSGRGTEYNNHFTVVPASTHFRTPRRGQKPKIFGVQTAIVVGPAGEEIYTDVHGRIKVQFHWDREGKQDDHSSCWVRVSQAWAGAGWGAMVIPRIGQEVLVCFEEGDPDRPIVTGCLYHGDNSTPYGLPGEKTKSTLKSNSSPGGGGFNEIRLEDKKGAEELFVHAQKDHNTVVLNDQTLRVDNNRTIEVHANHTETIDKDMQLTVTGKRDLTVVKDETTKVDENRSLSVKVNSTVKVGGDMQQTIDGSKTIAIKVDRTETIDGKQDLTIKADNTETVQGKMSLSVDGDLDCSAGGASTHKATKDYVLTAKKVTLTAEDELKITVGDATLVMKKDGKIQLNGKDLDQKASGKVNVKADGSITLKGKDVQLN